MKTNNQKGFIVQALIGIIAVLLIGGGAYFYSNKKVETPSVIDSNLPNQTLTGTNVSKQKESSAKVVTNILRQEGNGLIGDVSVLIKAGEKDLDIFPYVFYPQFAKVERNFKGTTYDVIQSKSNSKIEGDFVKNSDNTITISANKEVKINYVVMYKPTDQIEGGTYYITLADGHDSINYKPNDYVPVEGEVGLIYPSLKVIGQTESNRLIVSLSLTQPSMTQNEIKIFGRFDKTLADSFGTDYFQVRDVNGNIYKFIYDSSASQDYYPAGVDTPYQKGNFTTWLNLAKNCWAGISPNEALSPEHADTLCASVTKAYFVGKEMGLQTIRLTRVITETN